MREESRRLVISTTSVICLLLIALVCIDGFTSNANPFESWKQKLSNWRGILQRREVDEGVIIEEEEESLKFVLRRLVRGEDRQELENTGFSCHFDLHSEVCVVTNPVRIGNNGLTIHVSSDQERNETTVRPYARREDETAMNDVTALQIVSADTNLPPCNYTHSVPAMVFSSGGFTGNVFHEFNEIIIPLFITCHHFRSQLQFIITDFQPWWVEKYNRILKQLSNYEVINPAADGSVHCFPGSVIGLKYHNNLALNKTEIPGGYSMFDFRHFLRKAYNLQVNDVSEIQKPRAMLITRNETRRFLNEHEMVRAMEELGFQVVVPTDNWMSNLDTFAEVVNSCNIMVGAHGAALTNELFLPNGAVMVQVVPLQLEWASTNYFGSPANEMGINYLEYKIEPEESSLLEKYGRDHPVITDPQSIVSQGYYPFRAVYVDGQDLKVNITRFRKTIVQAMELIGLSVPLD
ncbi:alpha-1,3-arabinosyltransferase XAT3-like [Tripterygium wilfordii]|uniref:alpha-1,3-arabinosyltransferase XAT3-like n=1 Tax=Tripterygium wilfordii TaxID=458696 RepID=UPI0018F8219E|nr:alpha-1,3-arabinosyltransferase XAT3-like [Tripterygium wilfordii]